MAVTCPYCGHTQEPGFARCIRCERLLPSAGRDEGGDQPDLTPQEIRVLSRTALKYAIVPIAIGVVVMCALVLMCSAIGR